MNDFAGLMRPMIADDKAFIMQSWLRSFYTCSEGYLKPVDRARYAHIRSMLIDAAFKRPAVSVTVAMAPEEPGVILGWMMVERVAGTPVVHYVYVKNDLRKQGLCKALLRYHHIDPRSMTVSHVTHFVRRYIQAHGLSGVNFNPWSFEP